MQVFIFLLLLLGGLFWWYFEKPVFGKLPEGKRLERVTQSPNYKGGQFVNLEHTPNFAPNINTWDAAISFINKPKSTQPSRDLPSVQNNIRELDPMAPALVWFGHSSYYMQVDGLKILVDPVFSGNASPVSIFAKSYPGTNGYQAKDMPPIDVLLLTHDHYDHLDYETFLELKDKCNKVVTSLGVGAHLVHWGFPEERIIELDWQQSADLGKGFSLKALPARHFSGRKFTRNQSLWSSFSLVSPSFKIYLGGDSGYGSHFKNIAAQEGPYDLAILECGQYNDMWPYIHMRPEEVVTAAQDLQAKVLLPVHWGKFALALHPWNEPIKRVTRAAKEQNQKITTPRIGEFVMLNEALPDSVWWDFE